MKKYLMTAAAIALLMTTAAQAKQFPLGNFGTWSTALHTDNGDGRGAMCSMTTTWRWANGATGIVQFKWLNGHWFTQITKSNWRIASGTEIPMTIWFDNGDRKGTGFVHDDQTGGSTIEIGFDSDAAGFMADVANAKQMRLTFDSGNELPWVTASMQGSRNAVASLGKCIDWAKANAPTQPGAQSSTQPSAKPTQPTQPATAKKDDGGI